MKPEYRKRSIPHCKCRNCREHPANRQAKEHRSINRLLFTLDEKHRRRFVGVLALQWGRGAIEKLTTITGLSRTTIRRGRNELKEIERPRPSTKIRGAGGGRKLVEKNIPRS